MRSSLYQIKLACALMACALPYAHGADLIANTGSAYLWAEPGSYMGYSAYANPATFVHGVSGVFHSRLDGTYDATINISADDNWHFAFEAPRQASSTTSGRVPLEVGLYDNAVRYPFNAIGQAGMAVGVNASMYNTLSGWFNVLEVAYDANAQVTTLAVDFAEYGESATKSGPALYGSLRFNSAIPLTITVPEPSSVLQLGMGLCCLSVLMRRRQGINA